jgi:hypothetical protein
MNSAAAICPLADLVAKKLAGLFGRPDALVVTCALTCGKRCDDLGIHRLSEINHTLPFFSREHASEPAGAVLGVGSSEL